MPYYFAILRIQDNKKPLQEVKTQQGFTSNKKPAGAGWMLNNGVCGASLFHNQGESDVNRKTRPGSAKAASARAGSSRQKGVMMINRNTTLFSIRYAVRVLERYARFQGKISTGLTFITLLAGSGAIAALGAQSLWVSLIFGVLFAIAQAIEFSVNPADKRALALAQRKAYADLLASQAGHQADSDLDAVYQRIVATDEVVVPEFIKELAYNDVVRERGCEESYLFDQEKIPKLLRMFA